MKDFRTLPKIELHLHIEGAASPKFVRTMAMEKNIQLQSIFDKEGNYSFISFDDFLNIYECACIVLKTPEDYKRLAFSILQESASNGVIYCEMFVSPDFCGDGDIPAWKEYIEAMHEAAVEAENTYGIMFNIIATAVRHFGKNKIEKSAKCAAETAGQFVTGFGLGGRNLSEDTSDAIRAFDIAREAGLGLTCHAGEGTGFREVKNVIDSLHVNRIGHGVSSIENKELIEQIIDNNIVLEICPISNIELGLYNNLKEHPVNTLYQKGVPVTVSTDDPPFFKTNMTREYDLLAQTFGWGMADFRTINMTAANAAFCDRETRDKLIQIIESTYS